MTRIFALILILALPTMALDPVQALHPGVPLTPGRDYVLAKDGSIAEWKIKRFPRPTSEQLAASRAAISARTAQVLALRAGLLEEFTALQPGEQVLFEPALAKIRTHLVAGKVADARAVIATIPIPESLEPSRARMLALFPD